jgi:hypothetical protein
MCSMSVHYIIQKPLITNKMHKEVFFLTCNTLLHVSTLLGHLQGELFVVVKLRLHFIVELLTVYTANSSTIKCNSSVTTTKSSP